MNANVSAPMPSWAASLIVSRLEQATHSGGCGFCRGLGMTLRIGKSKYFPWYSTPPSPNIGISARTASSNARRARSLAPKKPTQ